MIKDNNVLEDDMESINLGNLNTVEFDLDLPCFGNNGTLITWESKDTRYLKRDGKVIQPRNGTGKRVVVLVGRFQYKELIKYKEYNITILEENKKLEITYIHPIHVFAKIGEPIELANIAIIETNMKEVLTHTVDWKDQENRIFHQEGSYEIVGCLMRSNITVTATIEVLHRCKQEEMLEVGMLEDICCDVALGHSLFYDIQMEMQNVLLGMSDDQMLYNVRCTCGLDTKHAPAMSGWDTPDSNLRGHTTGHYLSALAKCYKASKNQEMKEKADYMIQELKKCQERFATIPNVKKGYLAGFDEAAYDALEAYKTYPQVWAPYYTMHKLMAGLLDCYEILKNEEALQIVWGMGDWLYERLQKCSRTQRKTMWGIYIAGEYGGINESMAKLYRHSKQKKHILAAKMFDNDRLFVPMLSNTDALCYLHVNQHVPQVLGALEIFKGTKEKKYYTIAKNFWNMVVKHHMYTNGGVGEGEIFHSPNAIASMIDDNTAETCATYNMLKLTKELFQMEPKKEYMDYYERALLNHIVATRVFGNMEGSTYFFPMEPGSKKSYQDENSCCHGTGLENHFQYMDAIYSQNHHIFYIHLFISSHYVNDDLQLYMDVDMNEPGCISIKVNSSCDKTLKIRIPYWANTYEVMLHNEILDVDEQEGYLHITKTFHEDVITINFECSYFLEPCVDDPMIVSLHYGPYALCALHDSRDYLVSNLTQRDICKQMKKNKLTFYDYADLLKFIPLFKIEDQRYHTYIKVKGI